jgi:hypothetical protein
MGKKTLTNAHCLLDLIEKAPVSVLRTFSNLTECQPMARGFDWSQDDNVMCSKLLEHIKHLRKEQRELAEQEALRILRLASPRGAMVLSTVADQLHDADLQGTFANQAGAEIGRAVWMRSHSEDTARLFDVAETILNTNDIRGRKRLYDAFDVPCGDQPPPFLWNDSVKKELESQFTKVMRLSEPCELVYVPIVDQRKTEDTKTIHYLVVRFAGDQVSAVQMVNRNRKSFFYYPARDATLVYIPDRHVVEVFAHTRSSQAPLADVLSKHGFKMPLSNRPLNRTRYDLSPFAKPIRDIKPRLDGAKVERLYLTEAKALLQHATDAISLHIDSGADLQDVIAGRWADHPFSQPGGILGVTLVANLVLDGESTETLLSIELAEPGRCSLQGERDPRMRRIGTELLEKMGVLKPLHPGSGLDDPKFVMQVARLLEFASNTLDGFALSQLGIDIDRFEDEGILIEGDRITEKIIESADGEKFAVTLERSTDADRVFYRDPLSGDSVFLSAKHARRWKVDLDWLREEIVTALGTSLKALRHSNLAVEPSLLGEIDIDGHAVAIYFATRMANDRQYAKVDAALRLCPKSVPGILLTTSTKVPFCFAGTNVIVDIEDVLTLEGTDSAIDLTKIKLAYRHNQLAAMGGSLISLKVSPDGTSAVLYLPGKAPWKITSKNKVTVLQRLVDAHHANAPHVNTKKLMDGTNYASPSNLFPKSFPWRDYIVRVPGTQAWQLNVANLADVIEDAESEIADLSEALVS